MNSIRRYKAIKPHLYREYGVWYCALGNWIVCALTPIGAYNNRMSFEGRSSITLADIQASREKRHE